jgi:hypothetical protein
MLQVFNLRTTDELIACVDMYKKIDIENDNFINFDKEIALQKLFISCRSGHFARIIKEDNELIAWILASTATYDFSNELIFKIRMFLSNQSGVKGFKCIEILHEEVIDEAKRLKIKRVFTENNFYNERLVYVKLLEKLGWKRKGYMAYFETGVESGD